MYRQSFFLVVLALIVMGILFAGTRFIAAIPGVTGLPSSYDPKVNVEEAIMTSSKPLLIEFYTDTCQTCQHVTPWVHQLNKEKYHEQLTFIMVDVNDPAQGQVAQLFGIEYVPAIFVFDFKHMTKVQINENAYASLTALDKEISQAILEVKNKVKAKPPKPIPAA